MDGQRVTSGEVEKVVGYLSAFSSSQMELAARLMRRLLEERDELLAAGPSKRDPDSSEESRWGPVAIGRWWNERVVPVDTARLIAHRVFDERMVSKFRARLKRFPELVEELPRSLEPLAGWVTAKLKFETFFRSDRAMDEALDGKFRDPAPRERTAPGHVPPARTQQVLEESRAAKEKAVDHHQGVRGVRSALGYSDEEVPF